MRFSRLVPAALLVIALVPAAAPAQRPGAAVQLPTWSSVSGSTTVSVPDGGSALMGGITRSASGRNEFGTPLLPLRNSSIGSQSSASSMRVTAQIHDFEAMERALLSQAGPDLSAAGAASSPPVLPRQPKGGESWIVRGQDVRGQDVRGQDVRGQDVRSPESVGEIKAEHARKLATAASEAVEFFQRGQRAEAEGKPGVAKIYYQMVVRRVGGDLGGKAQARLDVLGPKGSRASQLADKGS